MTKTVQVLAHYTFKDLKQQMLPFSQSFYLGNSHLKHTRKFLKLGQTYLAMQIARTHAGRVGKGHIVGITNYQKAKDLRHKETG